MLKIRPFYKNLYNYAFSAVFGNFSLENAATTGKNSIIKQSQQNLKSNYSKKPSQSSDVSKLSSKN